MNNTKTRDCIFRPGLICDQFPCTQKCGWNPAEEERRKKELREAQK